MFLVLLMSKPMLAGEPMKFTLKEAVEFARKNNLTLKNADLDLISSQKKVNEIVASGLPQVNATGSFMNNTQIPTQVLPNFLKPIFLAVNMPGASSLDDNIAAQFGQKFSTSGSITASQLLFDGGFLMGVKASREYVNLSRILKNRTEVETEVNVSKAYCMVLVTENALHMLDTNILTLEKAKSDFEKLNKSGFVESTEYDRMALQLSNIKIQREKTEDGLKLALMMLKFQMGISVFDSVILSDKLDKLMNESSAPAMAAAVEYSKRPEYKALKQAMSLNNMNVKRYQFGYAPSLAAFVTHQENTFGSSFSKVGEKWYPGTFWGLSLNVPIFDGMRKSAQIQQAKIEVKKNENDLKNLEAAIDQQVFAAKMSYERSGQQMKQQEENLKLAQQIYDKVNLKYKNGVGSSLELTTAQGDLAVARQNYLQTVYDHFTSGIELKKAIGDIR